MAIKNIDSLVDLIRKSHDEELQKTEYLRFDQKNPQHRVSIAFYGSILELTTGTLVLIENRSLGGVPVLLRTILEAFVDLVNLVDDPEYSKRIDASNYKEWLRVFKSAKDHENPYLNELKEAGEFDDFYEHWQEKYDELVAVKCGELHISKKFEMAGMSNEYYSMYNFLCAESHNNLRALIGRHVEIDSSDTDFNIVYYQDISLSEFDHYIHMIGHCLVQSSRAIHQLLDSQVKSEVDQIAGRYRQFIKDNVRKSD